jgi:hypothetical protein
MRGRRINCIIEVWLGLGLASTASDTLTEKVLIFNMIFYDSTKNIFVAKHQNKAEFKNLDKSEGFSRNFTGLRTSAASTDFMALGTVIQ